MSDKTQEFQQQALEALRVQQEAYLQAMRAWRDGATEGASPPQWPPPQWAPPPQWPEMPSFDTLPNAAEIAEAYCAFTAEVFKQQSRFMEDLGRIMAEKKGGT